LDLLIVCLLRISLLNWTNDTHCIFRHETRTSQYQKDLWVIGHHIDQTIEQRIILLDLDDTIYTMEGKIRQWEQTVEQYTKDAIKLKRLHKNDKMALKKLQLRNIYQTKIESSNEILLKLEQRKVMIES
jgi:hypothetical protein